MNTPGGKCPGCGIDIDWHTEWLHKPDQDLVYRGQAATDCPGCGIAVLMPKFVNFSRAPDGTPVVRRSLVKAQKWAAARVVPIGLDDYFQQPPGAPYKTYRFQP
jgi:hypothetical protein